MKNMIQAFGCLLFLLLLVRMCSTGAKRVHLQASRQSDERPTQDYHKRRLSHEKFKFNVLEWYTGNETLSEIRRRFDRRRTYFQPHLNYSAMGINLTAYDEFKKSSRYKTHDKAEKVNITVELFKLRYGRDPPRNFEKWVDLALQQGVETDPAHYDQIHVDLWPYRQRGGLTSDDYHAANAIPHVTLVEIKGGQFFKEGRHSVIEEPLLHDALSFGLQHKLLPAQFFAFTISWGDEPHSWPADVPQEPQHIQYRTDTDFYSHSACMSKLVFEQVSPTDNRTLGSWHPFFRRSEEAWADATSLRVPNFADCKLYCNGDVVIPRTEYRSYNQFPDEWENQLLPWKAKEDTVFFRGSLHPGNHFRSRLNDWREGWMHIPRGPLRPFNININFTKDISCRDSDEVCSAKRGIVFDHVFSPPLEQYRHKYIVVPDGITWPSRWRRDLRGGSVVLYASIFTTWMTGMLHPFEHYVPIPEELNLEGLTEVMRWLATHDDIAETIAEKGQHWARRHARNIDMMMYTVFAFMQLADICHYCAW